MRNIDLVMRIFKVLLTFFIISNSVFCQNRDLIPYIEGNLYGYCDSNGEIILKPIYKGASTFEYGYASVRISTSDQNKDLSNKSIVIDKKGEIAIKDTFDLVWSFMPALIEVKNKTYKETIIAQVQKDDETFYIDTHGKRITQNINAVRPIENYRKEQYVTFPYKVIYSNTGKNGILYQGEEVVAPLYEYISVIDIEKGIFIVVDNDREAILNSRSKAPLKWYKKLILVGKTQTKDTVLRYFFAAEDSTENSILINDENQVVLPGSYRYINEFDKENGILKLYSVSPGISSTSSLYNLNTKQVINITKYKSISLTKYNGIYKVLFERESPYLYKQFYINSKGMEFYKE